MTQAEVGSSWSLFASTEPWAGRVLALVPWLALSAALYVVSRETALPRLDVGAQRPLWEVRSRWLQETLALGVVMGAAWSALLEDTARRRAVGHGAFKWARWAGLVCCCLWAASLGEAGAEPGLGIVYLLFGLPLFASSFYVIRSLGDRIGDAPLTLAGGRNEPC